ncbi:hypothetical protein [uncultured Mediterranean phage]|nr:hypothetical protein [uncultured Mediterranean phage]
MGLVPFTLETDLVLDNTNVTGDGIFELHRTDAQSNSGDYEGIKVVIEYDDFTPDPNDPLLNSNYSLSAVVEGRDASGAMWYPLIRQFDILRNPLGGKRQILVVSPSMFVIDEGIPIDDWDGEKVTTRYNKKQDRLTDNWRVRVEVRENKHGTADAFTSIKVNIFGARFNA